MKGFETDNPCDLASGSKYESKSEKGSPNLGEGNFVFQTLSNLNFKLLLPNFVPLHLIPLIPDTHLIKLEQQ